MILSPDRFGKPRMSDHVTSISHQVIHHATLNERKAYFLASIFKLECGGVKPQWAANHWSLLVRRDLPAQLNLKARKQLQLSEWLDYIVVSPPLQPPDYDQLITDGQKYMQNDQLDEAFEQFEKVFDILI